MLKNNIILIAAVCVISCTLNASKLAYAMNENEAEPVSPSDEMKNEAESSQDKQDSNSSFSGNYLSSQFSRASGDIDSAIKSLEVVYKKTPNDVEISNQLMGLYLIGGKVEKAMDIASNISNNDAKEPISALMLSLRAIKKHDIAGATKILDKVPEDGGQLWLPLISAWLDAEQKKLLKPLILEELSAEVGRAAPIVNYHLALINAKAGFTKEAAENFKKAIKDTNQPPARVLQMMLAFYDNNHSPAALKPLVSEFRTENNHELKSKLPLIDNAKDGATEILLTMGSIMLAADVAQDATLYLQLTLYLNPNLEIAIIALAQAYAELQQFTIANELLEKIPENSPLHNAAQLYTAVNLGSLKKTDEALAKLDVVIQHSPYNIEAYMAKGDLLRNGNRHEEAIAVYQSVLKAIKEEKSQHWPIFFAIATSYDKLGNWSEAEKYLKRSIKLSPNQPDVLNYLGFSYLMRGENLEIAKGLIEKAIKIRPSDPQIMDSMGWALFLLKDYKKSVEYLERAVSLLPADVTVNDHLGDVYWMLGRKNEARFQWNRAITFSKDELVSENIRKKVEDGLTDQMSVANSVNSVSKIAPVAGSVTAE